MRYRLPRIRRRLSGIMLMAALLAWHGLAGQAAAGQIFLNGLAIGGGTATLRLRSFEAEKFKATIHQAYDFSCGSAALGTLLTFGYGIPVTEKQVFASMIRHGNKTLIQKEGFSLLDLKQYLARRGLPSGGFRAPLPELVKVGLPAIVLINDHGYRHFVVVRGVRDGRILLSDPAVGMRSERIGIFKKQWSGISFLILADVARGRANFTDHGLWHAEPGAPVALARYAIRLATLQQVTIRTPDQF
jgi:predicted double-glycine peptidase